MPLMDLVEFCTAAASLHWGSGAYRTLPVCGVPEQNAERVIIGALQTTHPSEGDLSTSGPETREAEEAQVTEFRDTPLHMFLTPLPVI